LSPLEQYRRLVLDDPALQAELDVVEDSQQLAELAARQASEHGIELGPAEVLQALQRARQSWLLRMLP